MINKNNLAILGSVILSLGTAAPLGVFAANVPSVKPPTVVRAPQAMTGQHGKTGVLTHQSHLFGTVTAVNASGFTFTSDSLSAPKKMKTASGTALSAAPLDFTVQTDTKTLTLAIGAQSAGSQAAVKVGDHILVMGNLNNTTNTVAATRIMIMPAPGAVRQFTPDKTGLSKFMQAKLPAGFKPLTKK